MLLWVAFLYAFPRLPGLRAQRRAHADMNNDGVVDRKEARTEKRWEDMRKSKANDWWETVADTDGNGIVSGNEAAAWKTLVHERIDINHDGIVDNKERRLSWRHARSKVNTPVEKSFDADGDGWLAPSETRMMLKERSTLMGLGGTAKVDTAIEKEYDSNGDGFIDVTEAATLREDVGT
ncbi:MAG: hypothetical protein KKF80_02675 [Candidatus Omnitrophica bacterium]|nr:hypothetical protein [Candidatus Omnitrophota bacterium]